MSITHVMLVSGCVLFLALFYCGIWRGCKCMKRSVASYEKHILEHKVINQRIKIGEKKFVDLEIRVKLLEEEESK